MEKKKYIVILIVLFVIFIGIIGGTYSSLVASIIDLKYDDIVTLDSGSKATLDLSQIDSNVEYFNRYTIRYSSNVYVKGVITYTLKDSNGQTREEKERFFLEPKSGWTFSSFINGYIDNTQGSSVKSITFENIGNSSGTFNIHSFDLVIFPVLSDLTESINGSIDDNLTEVEKNHYIDKQNTVFIGNNNIKLGLSLRYGGSVNYISGNSSIFTDEYAGINLINSNDNGRFIQQCYYGNSTYRDGKLYVAQNQPLSCNTVDGMYNPIQGGFRSNCDECGVQAGVEYNSKIIDIGISDDKKTITIRTKPSLWELSNEQYKSDYYDYYGGFTADAYMTTEYTVYDTYIAVTSSYIDFTENVNDTASSDKARSESPSVYTISALNDFYAYSRKSNVIKKYENNDIFSTGKKELINDEEYDGNGNNQLAVWSYWGGYFSTNKGVTEGLGVYRPDYDASEGYLRGFIAGAEGDKSSFDITPNNSSDNYGAATSFFAPIIHLNNGKISQFKKFEYDYVVTLGDINKVYTIMNAYRDDHNYKLSINPNGGTVYDSTNVVTPNEKLLAYWGNWSNISVPSRVGYKFLGYFDSKIGGTMVYDTSGVAVNSSYWKVNADSDVNNHNVEIKYQYIGKKDLLIYARWEPISYTISYDLGGGDISSGNKTSYTIETEQFTLNNPVKEGYTFEGWTGSNGNTPSTKVTISKGSTGNKSYTANWSSNEYTYNIIYKSSSGIELGTDTITKEYGTTNKVEPKTFTGYTSPENQTITWDSVTVKTITFTYIPIVYTITYDLNDGSVSGNPTSYTVEDKDIILKNPIKEGYTFVGWTGSNGTTKQTTVTIAKGSTGNKSYMANWSSDEYTYNVIYKSSSGIELGTDTITKEYGTTNTIKPKTFTGYTTPDEQSIKWDSATEKTITFTYMPIIYKITYDLNDGSVSGNPTSYAVEDNDITLKNPIKEGYTFVGWTGSNGTTKQTTVTIFKGSTGNKEYTANWSSNEYTYNVIYKSSSGIELGTDTITKEYGTTNTIKPKTFTGYTTPDEKTIKWDSTTEKIITFTYMPIIYKITYDLNGGSVSGNPTSYTVEDNAITLKNPIKEGYTFIGWKNNETGELLNEMVINKGTIGNKLYISIFKEDVVENDYVEFNDNLNVDYTRKIIKRIKLDTIYNDLLKNINTNVNITIKNKSGNKISGSDKVKTGDVIEFKLNSGTIKYTVSVLGDINGTGNADLGDVALLYRYLKGKIELEYYQIVAGDIINNGSIKVNDVSRIYRYHKGKISSMEVE